MILAEVRIHALENQIELGSALAEAWIARHRVEVARPLARLLLVLHIGQVLAQRGIAVQAGALADGVAGSQSADRVEIEVHLAGQTRLRLFLQVSHALVLEHFGELGRGGL